MAKYSTIAVIYGSDTSESEVSCRSGEFVASRIDGNEYDIYEIYARFGKWSLVACKKKNSMRITFPDGARPSVDKNDFSVNVLGERSSSTMPISCSMAHLERPDNFKDIWKS